MKLDNFTQEQAKDLLCMYAGQALQRLLNKERDNGFAALTAVWQAENLIKALDAKVTEWQHQQQTVEK